MKRLPFLLIFLLLSYKVGFSNVSVRAFPEVAKISESYKFTPENLKKYIEFKGIKHSHIVYAQAVLETGGFSSKIFLENHNLFGMKHPKMRKTTSLGTKYGHAYYTNWRRSVDDYLLWQQMFVKTPIETEHQYYSLLSNGWVKGTNYAENPEYTNLLKIIIKKHNI